MRMACSMNETILLGKIKGRSLGKITYIWDDNIKMGVKWGGRVGTGLSWLRLETWWLLRVR